MRTRRWPLVAMVVVASVVLSVLVCLMLVNRAKNLMLVQELKVGGSCETAGLGLGPGFGTRVTLPNTAKNLMPAQELKVRRKTNTVGPGELV